MNLKRIELKGFKSFADKTKIDFETGITGIVGPNGSGKSNISDAIKWVLGEQSAKSLRGSKMEDIIFNGTDKRKPLNYSEITMILDNSDGKYPLEYREVMVTRRVFRSGESEYYLNKTACRLKDIKELFMDTGIGTDGYSIIGQGKIDEILSNKPEDRRKLFEEAAGIVKYKSRKIKAERKLGRTDENLIRVRDIIFELEKQVQPLESQANKAESYIKYKEQLRDKELAHYKKNYDKLETSKTDIFENLNRLENSRREIEESINQKHGTYNQIEIETKKIESEIDELNDVIGETKEEIQKKEGLIELTNEKLSVADRDLLRYKEDDEDNKKNNDLDIYQVDRLNDELETLKEDKKNAEQNIKSQSQDLNTLKRTLEFKIDEKNTLSAKYVKILNELTAIETRENSFRNFESNIQNRIDDLEKKMIAEKENHSNLSDDFERINKEYLLEQKKLDEITASKTAIEKEKTFLEDELIQKSNEIRDIERKFDALKSKYKILNEMKNRHEGYFLSVKKTLEYLDKNEKLKEGFEGVVADLIQVPEMYETAIEMSIGGALQNLVTETEVAAKNILSEIKKNRLGRVTFMPLDAISGKKLHISDDLKKSDGFLGIASELIKYDSRYANIIDYILGRVVVFTEIDKALKFAKSTGYKFKIVTLDGDLLNPGGSITGGSVNNKKQSGLLGRNRELEILKSNIRQARDDYDKMRKNYHEKVELLDLKKSDFSELDKNFNTKLQLIQNIENNQRHLSEKLGEQTNRIDQFSNDLLNIQTEKNNSIKQLESMRVQGEEISATKQELEVAIENLGKSIEKNTANVRILESKISELKVYFASCSEKIEAKKNELVQVKNQIEKYKEKTTQNQERIKACISLRKENENILAKLRREKSDIVLQLENKSKLLLNSREKRDEFRRQLEVNEKEINDLRSEIENIQRQKHKLQIEIEKKDLKLSSMADKLFEDYEMRIEELNELKLEQFEEIELDKEVKRLKNRIKELGSINIESIEKYKEVKERYDFLKTQEHDLIEAKNSLEQVIGEMESQMRVQFRENLETIRTNFSEIFVQLFGGGKADIVISEDADILDSGIDIIAQPPGKKLQSILLLSGGEKALTAIALLFAILKMKPSPFCILDEIEAALDDANVCRFADYLNHYADQTQFIVITHRKGTMEAVDSLYGVTMEEKGVSKIVSVKLTEESINNFIQ